jgi:hypothetical protein
MYEYAAWAHQMATENVAERRFREAFARTKWDNLVITDRQLLDRLVRI